jgi:hypothetical protein
MTATKLYVFTLLLAVGLLSASCGSKSGDGAPAAAPGLADQTAFEGYPGKFAGRYTGTCAIQTPDRSYTNCSTIVRIYQGQTSLLIRTRFFLNPSNRSGNRAKLLGHSEDQLVIQGKALIGAQGAQAASGVIGERGFSFTRNGQLYRFSRIFPDHYAYTGTFLDASGRAVIVTGQVQRGSSVQVSNHRSNELNHPY